MVFRRPVDVCQAIPGLFFGSAPDRPSVRRLSKRTRITRVLDLRSSDERDPSRWPDGVVVRLAPVPDACSPDPELLADLVDWVRRELGAGQRVLVHCRAGQGRAPTVVIAVLVRMGYTVSAAHRAVKDRRAVVAPTDAQLEGLCAYERAVQLRG